MSSYDNKITLYSVIIVNVNLSVWGIAYRPSILWSKQKMSSLWLHQFCCIYVKNKSVWWHDDIVFIFYT